MHEYAWICLCKQDLEYASGPEHAKMLNIVKFWIWQGSQYVNVTQRSEYSQDIPKYALTEFWMYLRF